MGWDRIANSSVHHIVRGNGDKLYGVGDDGAVYENSGRSSHWNRMTTGDVSFIAIYEGRLYGLGKDNAVYRQDLNYLSLIHI